MAVYVLYSEFLNFFVWFIKFLPLFIILFPIHKAMWFESKDFDGPIPRRRLDERAVVAPRRPPDDRIGLHARLRCLATAARAPPLHADDRVTFVVEGPLRDDLCGNQNFTARSC